MLIITFWFHSVTIIVNFDISNVVYIGRNSVKFPVVLLLRIHLLSRFIHRVIWLCRKLRNLLLLKLIRLLLFLHSSHVVFVVLVGLRLTLSHLIFLCLWWLHLIYLSLIHLVFMIAWNIVWSHVFHKNR